MHIMIRKDTELRVATKSDLIERTLTTKNCVPARTNKPAKKMYE